MSEYTTCYGLSKKGEINCKNSQTPFLGEHDDLIDVVINDQKFLDERGITRLQIAARMKMFADGGEFEDDDWKVEIIQTKGRQYCPFDINPDIKFEFPYGSRDIIVFNKKIQKQIKFADLLIHLIADHQFFEGPDMEYRVEPEEAIQVLEVNKDCEEKEYCEMFRILEKWDIKAIVSKYRNGEVDTFTYQDKKYEVYTDHVLGPTPRYLCKIDGLWQYIFYNDYRDIR